MLYQQPLFGLQLQQGCCLIGLDGERRENRGFVHLLVHQSVHPRWVSDRFLGGARLGRELENLYEILAYRIQGDYPQLCNFIH